MVVAARLDTILRRARQAGHLGSASIAGLVAHDQGFVDLVRRAGARQVVDLGSGGGLPGLVLATEVNDLQLRMIEASTARALFLERAVIELGLTNRVLVDPRPAEEVSRDGDVAGSAEVVTARSFGPPAVVAECAGALLAPEGRVVVSEPPGSSGARWKGLEATGLPLKLTEITEGLSGRFVVLRLTGTWPAGYPRRTGQPRKHPLF